VVVAFLGTINPSSGDVSVFLPLEQAVLSQSVAAQDRTALYARYSLVGSLAGAFGALAAGLPQLLSDGLNIRLMSALQLGFLLYAGVGLAALLIYRNLSPAIEVPPGSKPSALGPSKGVVYRLAALFCVDSFASGLVVQSLLALWLFDRFGLSTATAGTIFFVTGLLTASSQLVAPILARRFGLINTMVFTHLPANVFLMLTPFMPNLWLAMACLFARSALSQMDVPARTSYVMAVVTPEERAAASSVTSVPKSLASAASPVVGGWLFSLSGFGWPLLIAGALKATYDLLLLAGFSRIRPPEEDV
jgi:predicted MFS family arabinose efflux permease